MWLPTELLTAAVFVGMLIGGLLAGSMADRYGRRYCLLVSLTINFTFGALSAAAPSVGWLIAARVFAGLGKPNVKHAKARIFPTKRRLQCYGLSARSTLPELVRLYV